jgi:hypothetical protein
VPSTVIFRDPSIHLFGCGIRGGGSDVAWQVDGPSCVAWRTEESSCVARAPCWGCFSFQVLGVYVCGTAVLVHNFLLYPIIFANWFGASTSRWKVGLGDGRTLFALLVSRYPVVAFSIVHWSLTWTQTFGGTCISYE